MFKKWVFSARLEVHIFGEQWTSAVREGLSMHTVNRGTLEGAVARVWNDQLGCGSSSHQVQYSIFIRHESAVNINKKKNYKQEG